MNYGNTVLAKVVVFAEIVDNVITTTKTRDMWSVNHTGGKKTFSVI